MIARLSRLAEPRYLRPLVSVSLVLWPLALWLLLRDRAPWSDEEHFLHTVRIFGAGINLDLLRTYPEMTAPLTYLIYSAWGHLAGFETAALRLLSPFIASATAITLWLTLRRYEQHWTLSLLCLACLILNPYFVGLSVFVFTDMLALLGVCLVLFAVRVDRPLLVAFGLAVATLSRQYMVFLVPGLALAALVSNADWKTKWRLAVAVVAGLVPLTLMIILWDGHLAPANSIRDVYTSEGLRFDPHALSLYLSAPAVYLFPLVALVITRATVRTTLLAAISAAFVLIFPVRASLAQVREGVTTVGFLHRAMSSLLSEPLVSIAFAIMAVLWLTVLYTALTASVREWRQNRPALSILFPWTALLGFLAVMPFSYLPWEKYALPLFVLGLLILGANRRVPSAG